MAESPIVLVSNRGPVSFEARADGSAEARRGGGGLASGLNSLGERGDVAWIAAAITDGDRRVAHGGTVDAAGFRLRLMDLGPEAWHAYYDIVSNETLWFLHHGLFDRTYTPSFDDHWRAAWDHYRATNIGFADAVAEAAPIGATVLVQDYHLSLVGARLRATRPDLRTVHFHHTPFAGVAEIEVLPTDVADELLRGLAAFDACGFHTHAWANRYLGCLAAADIDANTTFVAPLGVDAESLRIDATGAECEAAVADLDDLVAGRRLVARVDRIELTKNLMRGFQAFELLLERDASWRGEAIFVANCYPSREDVEAYTRYRDAVEAEVARINERWSDGSWTPIVFDTADDIHRSLATLRRNDVLVVNPVRDGLNLVAMEGALINERHGGLVLSRHAGAWESLSDVCDGVVPFDLSETAAALDTALRRPDAQRQAQAERRRRLAEGRTPRDWLADQLAVVS